MKWFVELCDEFRKEFEDLLPDVQDELLAHALLLQKFGPNLGRPAVDTLKGSRFPNMKELRFSACRGIWRVAFAFDPKRRAILLVAGNKAGRAERGFYKRLISKADGRYENHLRASMRR